MKEVNIDNNHLEETSQPESVCLLATKRSRKKQVYSSAISKRKRRVSGNNTDCKVMNSKSECVKPVDCDELTEFDSELLDFYKSGGTGKSSVETESASVSKLLHGLNQQDSGQNSRTNPDSQANGHKRKFVCDSQRQNITAIKRQSYENCTSIISQPSFRHSKKALTKGILDDLPNKKPRLNICKK